MGDDLKCAIIESLESRRVLSDLKSRVRAEVFNILEDKTVALPQKSPELFVAFELFRELLIDLDLKNTLSVLTEECGHIGDMQVDRDFISGELGFRTMDHDIPLILIVLRIVKEMKLKESTVQKESVN